LPVFAVAQFHPKILIPVDGFGKLHSVWLQRFRDHEFKHWLTRKWAACHNLLPLSPAISRVGTGHFAPLTRHLQL
jgi:hypothetical protein